MFDTKAFQREKQKKKLIFRYMYKNSIPANADNKVVAGENAKVMTVEILKRFVADATEYDIGILVDATWDWLSDGLSDIVEDCDGNQWLVFSQSDGVSTDAILEDVEEMCKDEGYDIDLYDWCEENDIDLDDMITEAADEIVENDDNLVWVSKGWDSYLGVFYKSHSEIREAKEKIEEFNEWMRDNMRDDFESHIEGIKECGVYFEDMDYVEGDFEYNFDCDNVWCNYAKEQLRMEHYEAMDFYKVYEDEFITIDDMDEYVEDLADEFDAGLDDHSCGHCLIYVKNPYYINPDNVDDEQYVVFADYGDRYELVGKDDEFVFDNLDYAIVVRDEYCRDNSVKASVCLVQEGMDENGVVVKDVVKCVA